MGDRDCRPTIDVCIGASERLSSLDGSRPIPVASPRTRDAVIGVSGLFLSMLLSSCTSGQKPETPVGFPLVRIAVGLDVCVGTAFPSAVVRLLALLSLEDYPAKPHLEETLTCLEQASDCLLFLECLGIEAGEPCDSTSSIEHCDGDVAVYCAKPPFASDGIWFRSSCQNLVSLSEGPGRCVMSTHGDLVCAAAECDSADGKNRMWCSEERAYSCRDGVLSVADCPAEGKICTTYYDPGGEREVALCAYMSECSTSHCDGNIAVVCGHGLALMQVDCSKWIAGGICIPATADLNPGTLGDGPSVYCGLPEYSRLCDSDTYEPECDGNMIACCIQGLLFEGDCSTFEGGECSVGSCGAQTGGFVLDPEVSHAD